MFAAHLLRADGLTPPQTLTPLSAPRTCRASCSSSGVAPQQHTSGTAAPSE